MYYMASIPLNNMYSMASIPFQSYSNDITMVELQEYIDMYYFFLCVVKNRCGKGQRDPLLLVELSEYWSYPYLHTISSKLVDI